MGNSHQSGRQPTRGRGYWGTLAAAAVVALLAAGCAQNELGVYSGYNRDNIIVKNPLRKTNPIVTSEDYWIQKDVVPEEQFPGPTPADLKSPEQDYILGPGDLIEVTVYELMAPGQPYTLRPRIAQTGMITFPFLGAVRAAGYTTRGLEEKLADMLEPDYIQHPQVTVFVWEYRNLNVAVLNGMQRLNVYPMTKQDMSLLELVASAGGVNQMVEDYGYVIRKYAPDEVELLMAEAGIEPSKEIEGALTGKPKAGAEKAAPEAAPKNGEKVAPEAAPTAGKTEAKAAPVAPKTAEVEKEIRDVLEKMAEGEMPPVKKIEAAEAAAEKTAPQAAPEGPDAEAAAALAKDQKDLSGWLWSDGKWVQSKIRAATGTEAPVVKVGAAAEEPAGQEPAVAQSPEAARLKLEENMRRYGVIQGSGQLKRIIRFDVRALQAGDPTQNVILRDGDVVTIPSPQLGDFYMAGEVARPGVYSLTGRKITVLQAITAAGGLSAVAVPWRTEIVRRLSESEEEIIYVDLGKISRGEVPDFYLQPEDLVRVGTDQGAVFNAVLRNAFRATYGTGFVYDMNFADFFPFMAGRTPIF